MIHYQLIYSKCIIFLSGSANVADILCLLLLTRLRHILSDKHHVALNTLLKSNMVEYGQTIYQIKAENLTSSNMQLVCTDSLYY